MKKRKALKVVLLIMSVILFTSCIAIAIYSFKQGKEYAEEEQLVEDIRGAVISYIDTSAIIYEQQEPIDVEENLLRKIDFDYLQNINNDALCWIYIPDTNIDYYVLQEEEEGSFQYLWNDINKEYSSWGSIFTPKIPDDSHDAHMLIFGHHMITHGYAFTDLVSYAKEDYAKEHNFVYLYYPDRAERWEVWCAGHVRSSDDVYRTPYVLGSTEYQRLLSHLSELSEQQLLNTPSNGTKTVVLSTCHRSWGGATGRFIVACVPSATYFYDANEYYEW